VRVLPDQGPALQFSGNQYFFNLWSCVHVSVFLRAELCVSFRHDSSLAQWESGLLSQQRWQFRESGKLIQPAGTARIPLYEMGLKVRELDFESP
jgi:hypothetical protein